MTLDKLKVIVFDLDYTLWPFWVDTHVTPPFKKDANGIIKDHNGQIIKSYPEVPNILKKLFEDNYILGVASRTSEIKGAKQLIDLFGWDKYFKYKEIFPGSKVTHFKNIKAQSQKEYGEMMFFDDEHRNIHDISKLGVVSVFVNKGVSKEVIEEGMQMFKAKHS